MKRIVVRFCAVGLLVVGLLLVIFSFLSLRSLDVIIHVVGGLWFLVFAPLLVNMLVAMRLMGTKSAKWPKWRIVFGLHIASMTLLAILLFTLQSIVNHKAMGEIGAFLDQVDPAMATIRIDGNEVEQVEEVLHAIQQVRSLTRWRSHITNGRKCEIIHKSDTLVLVIGQNVSRRDQYWVYYPKYRFAGRNSVGGFYYQGLHFWDIPE